VEVHVSLALHLTIRFLFSSILCFNFFLSWIGQYLYKYSFFFFWSLNLRKLDFILKKVMKVSLNFKLPFYRWSIFHWDSRFKWEVKWPIFPQYYTKWVYSLVRFKDSLMQQTWSCIVKLWMCFVENQYC
jgi:hypothetical protein